MPGPSSALQALDIKAPNLPDDVLLKLDNQLCFALYSASLTMTKIYKPLLDNLRVTYPQYLVLLVLWEHGEQSVSAIGTRLFLDSGTLTPLLKRMEAQGLLVRSRAAEDERRVVVSLTTSGKQLRKKATAVPREIMCATRCSLQELTGLTQRLFKLRSALADELDNQRAA